MRARAGGLAIVALVCACSALAPTAATAARLGTADSRAIGRLVTAFVLLISQFFDFRVGTAATTFAARRLEEGDARGAAAVFRLSYAVDLLTGIGGFVVVAVAGLLAGPHVAGHSGGNHAALEPLAAWSLDSCRYEGVVYLMI